MNLVIVTRQRGQQQTQKLLLTENSEITIGRGWHNDIVVDDEYVDPTHARLRLNECGELALEDLASENGTQVGNRKITGASVVDSGCAISLGDTQIEVHNAEIPVAPALKQNAARLFSNRFNSLGGVFLATLTVGLSLLVTIYALSDEAATGERIFATYLGAGTFLFVWTLLAALVGRLFRHETNAVLHWVFISFVSSMVVLLTFFLDVIKFNLDSNTASLIIDNALVCVLIAFVGYITFSLTTRLSRFKKVAIVCLLALLPVANNLFEPMLQEKHEAWSYWAGVDKLSHPPVFLFRKPTTLEAHIKTTDDLFTALDSEVADVSQRGAEPGDAGDGLQISEIE